MRLLLSYLLLLPFFCFNINAQTPAEIEAKIEQLYSEANYRAAVALAEQGIAQTAERDSTHLSFLHSASVLYNALGQYDQAESKARRLLQLTEQIFTKKSLEYIGNLDNYARIYLDKGDLDQAETLYNEAIAIGRALQAQEQPIYISALNSLANLYFLSQRLAEAEETFLQVIAIREKMGDVQSVNYGSNMGNLALFYAKTGRVEEGIALQKKVVALFKQLVGAQHPQHATMQSNLAGMYGRMGNFVEAKAQFLQVLQTWEAVLGVQHPNYATTLSSLAAVCERMGDLPQAERYYLQAQQILIATVGNDHANCLSTTNGIGEFYLKTGQLDKARAQFRQAMLDNAHLGNISTAINEQWEKTLSAAACSDMPQLLRSLDGLYRLHADTAEQIDRIARVALELGERHRSGFLLEENKSRIANSLYPWIERAVLASTTLPESTERLEQCFKYIEQNKALLLADAFQSQQARALSDLPDSLLQREQALLQQYDILQKDLVKERDPDKQMDLRRRSNELTQETELFRLQIQRDYPRHHQLKYAPIEADAKKVQQLLQPDMLFCEFFMTDTITYLFFIHKKEMGLEQIRLTHDSLSQSIADLRRSLSDYAFIREQEQSAKQLYLQSAHLLYRQLLAQTLARFTDVKHLIVVTDGELGHLPFEVFLTEKASNEEIAYKELPYLLKKYRVSYNYSAVLFQENSQAPQRRNNGQVLAFAADYPASGETVGAASVNRSPQLQKLRKILAPLPAAAEEINALKATFAGEYRYGKAANERDFKTLASEYSVLHLTMHGIADVQHPILSLLAFTENGDSIEDNFLHAWEIAHLKLNADLVVLSACETGYGTFQMGEGVMSLARSFMYAGVPALVVSLWEVNDASTATIMQQFYQNLSKGMDKAEALQQAKLQYLSQSSGLVAHPAYWSPFIQLGDSRAMQFGGSGARWGLWAGGAALLLGLGWLWRKKRG